MTTLYIDDYLDRKIATFAKTHDRSKEDVIRTAIETYLVDQNDLEIGQKALAEFYKDGGATYSLEQIKKENDL